MIWRAHLLRGYHLRAVDGALGEVEDFYFDDHAWTVRYMVVDTARWLLGRRVLIAPEALGTPNAERREVPVDLTMEKVKASPDVDTARPVDRQEEERLLAHYGWAPYWTDLGGTYPLGLPGLPLGPAGEPGEGAGDPNLRSMREVTGYHIAAADHEVGHVADFLIDEAGWVVRYLEIDTRNWLPGKHVLLAPRWVRAIDWSARRVAVALTRAEIESAPQYEHKRPLDRGYEQRLHGHYGQEPYWDEPGR
jgi:hypothetical protein